MMILGDSIRQREKVIQHSILMQSKNFTLVTGGIASKGNGKRGTDGAGGKLEMGSDVETKKGIQEGGVRNYL